MSGAAREGAILECAGVTKVYGGLVAVEDVSFRVAPGRIFAVVGPNGAGKTTLFELIAGASPITSGAVTFDGVDVTRSSVDEVCRLGLVRTFQTGVAFQSLSVLGNALIGAQFGRQGRRKVSLRFDRETVDRARDALRQCGLEERATASAAALSVIETRRLMFATAIAAGAKMMLLDEPVGGLTAQERGEVAELIRATNARGVTILMIEHVMRVVRELADDMLVLDHGVQIAAGTPDDVLSDEVVRSVYLGQGSVARAAAQ
jgi:branched-chain amino acid transport system ATP-binding protein